MTDIAITDLTNTTEVGTGNGVFDKLMQTVLLHIHKEYEDGKISGTDYANVYLGSLQSVMSQAVQFILSEQKAGKEADLVDAQISLVDSQIRESEEKIDLISAQTAKQYEDIAFSQARTIRENLLNNKQVLKIQKENINLEKQGNLIDEQILKTSSETDKLVAEIADQEFVTLNLRPEEVDLLQSRDAEQISATSRNTAESAQKVLLMQAQTLGFKSDTKQKLLKLMSDGYAVNLSIAGVGNVPESNRDAAIDQLAQEILDDLLSGVIIQSTTQVPDTGGVGDVPPSNQG